MVAWPEPFETVDALAKVAELKWPYGTLHVDLGHFDIKLITFV